MGVDRMKEMFVSKVRCSRVAFLNRDELAVRVDKPRNVKGLVGTASKPS